jgi:hypothetical protein
MRLLGRSDPRASVPTHLQEKKTSSATEKKNPVNRSFSSPKKMVTDSEKQT